MNISEEASESNIKFSEGWLTDRFIEEHGNDVRYVEDTGRWYKWDRHTWVECRLWPFTCAQELLRGIASGCRSKRTATGINSARTRAAIVSLARERDELRTTSDEWDRDPWLLGTPGGIVDLRTGSLAPGKPRQLISMCTNVCPDFTMDAPRWEQFLREITCGNKELEEYLQRYAGYCLTGITSEQVLAFLHGDGANGKGAFIRSISYAMGAYAITAPSVLFEESVVPRHSTELARLRGARLVSAQEIDKGKRWAESLIKQLTGGDPITARYMRQDDFTFQPVLKLIIAGNHKPELQSVGMATRRRYRLIPFDARIKEPDKDLDAKLQPEAPAILQWMIEGCLAWQESGLRTPEAVTVATDEYFEDADDFGSWLAECTEPGLPAESESFADLRASWLAWAQARGMKPGRNQDFTDSLRSAGYRLEKTATAGKRTIVMGIRIVRKDYSGDQGFMAR